jgi:hypothetical protein
VISVLTPESVLVDRVSYHHFVYYFLKPDLHTALFEDTRIIVSAAWGDVDVYVSPSWAERPFYSAASDMVESFRVKSAAVGGEDLTIRGQDLIEMCQQHPTSDFGTRLSGASDGNSCVLVIGVFGVYSADGPGTDFRIQATTSDSTIVLSTGADGNSTHPFRSNCFYSL